MGVGQTITVEVPAGPPPTTVPVNPATTTTVAPLPTTTTVAVGRSTTTQAASGTLPRTGAPLVMTLLLVAVALLLAGRLLVGLGRRRSRGGQQVNAR